VGFAERHQSTRDNTEGISGQGESRGQENRVHAFPSVEASKTHSCVRTLSTIMNSKLQLRAPGIHARLAIPLLFSRDLLAMESQKELLFNDIHYSMGL